MYVGCPEVNLTAELKIRELARVSPADQCPVADFQHQAHITAVEHLLAVEVGQRIQCLLQFGNQFALFLKAVLYHSLEHLNIFVILFHHKFFFVPVGYSSFFGYKVSKSRYKENMGLTVTASPIFPL